MLPPQTVLNDTAGVGRASFTTASNAAAALPRNSVKLKADAVCGVKTTDKIMIIEKTKPLITLFI
jgi:hypothetical protein